MDIFIGDICVGVITENCGEVCRPIANIMVTNTEVTTASQSMHGIEDSITTLFMVDADTVSSILLIV